MAELKEDEETFRHNDEGSGIGLDKVDLGKKAAHVKAV